jgi:hypothetical protein
VRSLWCSWAGRGTYDVERTVEPMTQRRPKIVAVSSTVLDLPLHRVEIREACLMLRLLPRMMEHMPAQPQDAVAASRALIEDADAFIGVYAFRYGFVPESGSISITEMEFDWAVAAGIPRFVFVMDEEHLVFPRDIECGVAQRRLKRFKKKIKSVSRTFTNPGELRSHALAALHHWLIADKDVERAAP